MFDGCREALDWYKKVFNARVGEIIPDQKEPQRVMHSTFYIGEDAIHAADDYKGQIKEAKDKPRLDDGSLYVYLPDVDEVWKRALDGGATSIEELKDQFWGDRFGQFRDPFGQYWGVAKWLGKPHGQQVEGGEAPKADKGGEVPKADKVCEASASASAPASAPACAEGAEEPHKKAKTDE
jgi:PhnB protein